jgi:signal transduction histidine kinase
MDAATANPESMQGTRPLAADPEWLSSAMLVLGSDGLIVEVNEAFAGYLGRPPDFFKGRDALESFRSLIVHGATLESFEKFLFEKRSFGKWRGPLGGGGNEDACSCPVWIEVGRARCGSQMVLHIQQVLPPLEELKQLPISMVDDSAGGRQQLLARTLELETSLQNIHQRWPGIIFTQRTNMTFRVISPRAQALTGFPPSELQRNPGAFWQFLHESDHAEFKNNLARVRTSPGGVNSTLRIKNVRTGKISYIQEHRIAVTRGGLVVSYHGVWIDVTRQMIAEKRLMGSAWKETLAVLTMGLAHDFRNTMAGIASLSDTLMEDLDSEDPNKEYLEDIRKNSMQANQLVQKILDLHQGKTGEAQYEDLNRLAVDVGDLVRKITPRRIQFDLDLCSGSLPVWLDPIEFRQVVVNLALNSVDAIARTGRLIIRTGVWNEETFPEHTYGFHPASPCAFFSVEDTGCGIPENQLQKIFEPFFTSKPMNKGSGLGLYNTRLFVERFQGAVGVVSKVGEGTSFQLFLPLHNLEDSDDYEDGTAGGEAPAQECAPSREPGGQRSATGRQPTIMVVGNPGRNLESTSSFLRAQGFSIFEVFQKSQAMELLENRTADFRILLVLIEDSCDEWLSYLDDLSMVSEDIPLVLKLQNCDQDSLRDSEIQMASWIISPEAPGPEILEKLTLILDARDA